MIQKRYWCWEEGIGFHVDLRREEGVIEKEGGKKQKGKKIKTSFLFWAYWIWQLASPRIMSEKTWNVSLDRRLTRISTVFLSIATVVESVFVDEVTPREPAEGKRVLGPRLWNHHKTFQTQEPHRRGWKLYVTLTKRGWRRSTETRMLCHPWRQRTPSCSWRLAADSGGMSGSPSFPNGERKGALSTAVGQQT